MTQALAASREVVDPRFAEDAQGVFFLAMQSGYINNPRKGTICALPGSNVIEFNHGKWRLLDVYATTPRSNMSAGTTHLWYEGIPVWMMQYMGEYQEEAIPTLKLALSRAYAASEWHGGRGIAFFAHGLHVYENNVDPGSAFAGKSSGEEFIMRRCGEGGLLGWHRYQSLWLW